MKKLKIGYFADGAWSHRAFEILINDQTIDVAFIVPRTDSTDNTLLGFSERFNIPYHKGVKINSNEFYELAKSYACDLFVSMSFNQIFKKPIANLPFIGTINCHAGKLPFYRGRNVLNWALINNEKEFGITTHFIDEGIDTGDIILQRVFPITDSDNYATLLKLSHEACAQILFDAIKLIQSNSFTRQKQSTIHEVGFYCGQRIPGDEIINWNQTSREVFNFIRAVCAPGPKARSTFNGQEILINSARLIENAPHYINTVGQIVGKTNDGYIVKTRDTTIEILEVESDVKLGIGDRLL
jgi:methionyl-tRNA formyltransferase